MTKKIFFDTDCISAFLWVNGINLVEELFRCDIVFPQQVYDELSNPVVPHLKAEVDKMITRGSAKVEDILVGSSEFIIYRKLTSIHNPVVIGKGESAAIAMAYVNHGILASNNLKDVSAYVSEYQLEHMTTLDIMILAEERGIASELELESLWREMKRKHILLPSGSYVENKVGKKT